MDRPLRWKIEKFLTDSAMPPTVFGRLAMSDPRFVFDLRNGREPGERVRNRAEHFMSRWAGNGSRHYVAAPGGRRCA